MPHSPEKPRKKTGWLTATAEGAPRWAGRELGGGGRRSRKGGEPRCCLADFLLCRANVTFHVNFPGSLGVSSLLSSLVENSPHTQSCPGESREGTSLSGLSPPGLSEVDLPESRCPILWDWPNGHRCPLLTPPFCVNCPRQITKLFLNQRALCLPSTEVDPG